MPLYLPILYGTVREGRRSWAVATWIEGRMRKRPGITTRLFDPRDLPFGNLERRVKETPVPSPEIEAFGAEIQRADGYVVVTPEYNFGIPGALKNLLDPFYREWNHKPFGVVTAGGMSGGLRPADQLRIGIPGLGAVSIPMVLPVHEVETAFDDHGPVADVPAWESRADRFLAQLEWYAGALARARSLGLPARS